MRRRVWPFLWEFERHCNTYLSYREFITTSQVKMVAQEEKTKYADPVYQAAHDNTYNAPVVKGIPSVLPPGVSQEQLDKAITELVAGLGAHAVFTAEKLKEYVDPYEIPETGHARNIPSAAVR